MKCLGVSLLPGGGSGHTPGQHFIGGQLGTLWCLCSVLQSWLVLYTVWECFTGLFGVVQCLVELYTLWECCTVLCGVYSIHIYMYIVYAGLTCTGGSVSACPATS